MHKLKSLIGINSISRRVNFKTSQKKEIYKILCSITWATEWIPLLPFTSKSSLWALGLLNHIFPDTQNYFSVPLKSLVPNICSLCTPIKILGGLYKATLVNKVRAALFNQNLCLKCFSMLSVKADANQLVQFLKSMTHPLHFSIPFL